MKEEVADYTELEPKTKKKKQTKNTKKEKFTVEEVKEKINILFESIAKILHHDYIFSEADFEQEAKGIVRLSEKFFVIGTIISLFDPVLILLGFWSKWTKLPKKKEENKQEKNDNNEHFVSA